MEPLVFKAARGRRIGGLSAALAIEFGYQQAAEKGLERQYIEAVAKLSASQAMQDLIAALKRSTVTVFDPSVEKAVARLNLDWQKLERILMDTFLLGAHHAQNQASSHFSLAFDIQNPRALEAAARSATRVKAGQSIKDAVRSVIENAFVNGEPVDRVARILKPIVGLTEPHARAVQNYERALAQSGMQPGRVQSLVERYAKRLNKYRAYNIARTETVQALSEGRNEYWQQAMDAGYLNRDETMREWFTQVDERTCPICLALLGSQAALGEPYVSKNKNPRTGESVTAMMPPAHPSCRCTEFLVYVPGPAAYLQKHLPGQHDQKLHGRRGLRAVGYTTSSEIETSKRKVLSPEERSAKYGDTMEEINHTLREMGYSRLELYSESPHHGDLDRATVIAQALDDLRPYIGETTHDISGIEFGAALIGRAVADWDTDSKFGGGKIRIDFSQIRIEVDSKLGQYDPGRQEVFRRILYATVVHEVFHATDYHRNIEYVMARSGSWLDRKTARDAREEMRRGAINGAAFALHEADNGARDLPSPYAKANVMENYAEVMTAWFLGFPDNRLPRHLHSHYVRDTGFWTDDKLDWSEFDTRVLKEDESDPIADDFVGSIVWEWALGVIEKHQGPGPHPGTGTEQAVHGKGGKKEVKHRRGSKAWIRAEVRKRFPRARIQYPGNFRWNPTTKHFEDVEEMTPTADEVESMLRGFDRVLSEFPTLSNDVNVVSFSRAIDYGGAAGWNRNGFRIDFSLDNARHMETAMPPLGVGTTTVSEQQAMDVANASLRSEAYMEAVAAHELGHVAEAHARMEKYVREHPDRTAYITRQGGSGTLFIASRGSDQLVNPTAAIWPGTAFRADGRYDELPSNYGMNDRSEFIAEMVSAWAIGYEHLVPEHDYRAHDENTWDSDGFNEFIDGDIVWDFLKENTKRKIAWRSTSQINVEKRLDGDTIVDEFGPGSIPWIYAEDAERRALRKHLPGQHEQQSHGNRGRGLPEPGGYKDFWQRNPDISPEEFRERYSEEEHTRMWNEDYEGKREYEARVNDAIARGEITPEEAEKTYKVWNHSGGEWGDLPPRMYHATTALRSVMESGELKTRRELNQGLGHGLGGGSDDTVSFTADKATAERIAEALHEARDVASGRRTPAQLVQEAIDGTGADRPWIGDLVRYWQGFQTHPTEWKTGDPFPKGMQQAIGSTDPGGRLDFYKLWSSYRQYAGGPMDPLFFTSDANAIAAMKDEDIGVIEVEPVVRRGILMNSLGEWRTTSGSHVRIISGVRKHLQGQHEQKTHGHRNGGARTPRATKVSRAPYGGEVDRLKATNPSEEEMGRGETPETERTFLRRARSNSETVGSGWFSTQDHDNRVANKVAVNRQITERMLRDLDTNKALRREVDTLLDTVVANDSISEFLLDGVAMVDESPDEYKTTVRNVVRKSFVQSPEFVTKITDAAKSAFKGDTEDLKRIADALGYELLVETEIEFKNRVDPEHAPKTVAGPRDVFAISVMDPKAKRTGDPYQPTVAVVFGDMVHGQRPILFATDLGEHILGSEQALEAVGYEGDERQLVRVATRSYIDSWAAHASDKYPISIALQYTLADEFGLDQARRTLSEGVASLFYNDGESAESEEWKGFAARYTAIRDGQSELLRSFVHATYDNTQEMLRSEGVEDMVVARGVHHDRVPFANESDSAWEDPDHNEGLGSYEGYSLDIRSNPATSWTTRYSVARDRFAIQLAGMDEWGIVYTTVVPSSQVYSTGATGPGCLGEGEVILLGQPIVANGEAVKLGRREQWEEFTGDPEAEREHAAPIIEVLERKPRKRRS